MKSLENRSQPSLSLFALLRVAARNHQTRRFHNKILCLVLSIERKLSFSLLPSLEISNDILSQCCVRFASFFEMLKLCKHFSRFGLNQIKVLIKYSIRQIFPSLHHLLPFCRLIFFFPSLHFISLASPFSTADAGCDCGCVDSQVSSFSTHFSQASAVVAAAGSSFLYRYYRYMFHFISFCLV